MKFRSLGWMALAAFFLIWAFTSSLKLAQEPQRTVKLPTSKILMLPVPGHAQRTNSLPTAAALSPGGRYLAILNNGFGTEESGYQQSIAVLDLATNKVTDFPDSRLGQGAHQTYFVGLAFSSDGTRLYASMASLTDPTGSKPGSTGNGIAVYQFMNGRLTPGTFLKIPLAPLERGKKRAEVSQNLPRRRAISFPAGIAVIRGGAEKLLVAENLADDVILMDAATGRILHRFPLSDSRVVPAEYPYGVVATRDGSKGYCSLWNGSAVAELDLAKGQVMRRIPLDSPKSPVAAGSHPTAMLLSPDEKRLYVTLTNSDRVAVIDAVSHRVAGMLTTELPGQKFGGSDPMALALSADGRRLFVADASANAVAVFDASAAPGPAGAPSRALGFIPTEWYPTALAVQGDDLFVITGKGEGTGPNSMVGPRRGESGMRHPYIATLLHGSVARHSIRDAESHLPALTHEVEESNLMIRQPADQIRFASGSNPIHHVIYIIKENRTYDQIFGDIPEANGDPALVLYGKDITPNEHKLARQFGILDNFYCSGEVSGDGHVWSTAAITSDYNEKTWQINYRSQQRTYDYEGEVMNGFPLEQGVPDVDEPGTGFIWANVARHGLSHRNYGEFVATHWCDAQPLNTSPRFGTPLPAGESCPQVYVRKGQPLPSNVGEPHGSISPWPWPVPMIARDQATKPELEGHYDPRFADFRVDYPDQLRVDEFLDEFRGFVHAREKGHGTEFPQFVILRLPDDHTAGTTPGMPTPSASVADNDLAVGRVVEAVSHSPYWDDTAILILEDDAQDGADHVDAHRSTALVISKYSPGSEPHPWVDHNFYTTVNMIHTLEELLGLPPMNNNDARAPVMAAPFSGPGDQPPFTADRRNLENGLVYQMNSPDAPGARQSARMDFTHADAANAHELNAILWRDRKGNEPMPKPRHTVIREDLAE
jgi:DNA-binding beta-propeller fold protein YncE